MGSTCFLFQDAKFLTKYMPNLMRHLHYRVIDVSTVKELAMRWDPDLLNSAPKKKLTHRALDDINESIEELKFYKKNFFKWNSWLLKLFWLTQKPDLLFIYLLFPSKLKNKRFNREPLQSTAYLHIKRLFWYRGKIYWSMKLDLTRKYKEVNRTKLFPLCLLFLMMVYSF